MGAIIKSAIYTWFKLLKMFPNVLTIEYIRIYIETKDNVAIIGTKKYGFSLDCLFFEECNSKPLEGES